MEPPARRQRVVLEEEEYLGEMRSIIERDYFPEVARRRGDEALPMSLGQFSATYTSEDNDSFEKQLAKDHRDHVRKYWWSYDRESLLEAGIDLPDASRPGLYVLSDGTRLSAKRRRIADEAAEADEPHDARPANLAFSKHVVRAGGFFFPPTAPAREMKRENNDKSKNPLCAQNSAHLTIMPSIEKANTRFEQNDQEDDDPIVSFGGGGGGATNYFKNRLRSASSGFPVLSEVSSEKTDDDFVPMTPTVEPGGRGDPGGKSPLVTWGVLAAPPQIIEREELARALDAKAKRRKQKRYTPRSRGKSTPLFGTAYTPSRCSSTSSSKRRAASSKKTQRTMTS